MTPEQQVKEIIKLLNPENPNDPGIDAVFLVQKAVQNLQAKVAAKDKQIALLEAKIEAEGKLRHDIENEKLASETKLKDEKKKIMDDMGLQPRIPGNKAPGRKL